MGQDGRWTAESIGDLTGKTAVVTGANSGIGLETARALADKGATVVMACRDTERGQQAADSLLQDHPEASLEVMELDLASLESVRRFAEAYIEGHDGLHLLVNNAGVMAPPDRRETADGFELQIGTNHLGHFALTGLLFDLLRRTPGSRVVVVSSMAHRGGKIDFEDLQAERGYTPFGAYGQSKLANLLFTYELQRRLDSAGVGTVVAAAHPGWTATNLQAHSKLFSSLNPLLAQAPPMGALPTLYAATAEGVDGGDFVGPGGLGEMRGYPKKVTSNKRSHDRGVAAELWRVSEDLTGVEFPGLA